MSIPTESSTSFAKARCVQVNALARLDAGDIRGAATLGWQAILQATDGTVKAHREARPITAAARTCNAFGMSATTITSTCTGATSTRATAGWRTR